MSLGNICQAKICQMITFHKQVNFGINLKLQLGGLCIFPKKWRRIF